MAPREARARQGGPKALTGPREQLGNLLAFRHVLDGGIDLLSDGQHQTLPFQVAVPSVHQPVYMRNTQIAALPQTVTIRADALQQGLWVVFTLAKGWGSREDGHEDRPEGGPARAKQTLAT